MDSNGIINQINEWYDNDTKQRCAFVILAEKEESDNTVENRGCLIGNSKLITRSLAYQICKDKDTKEVIEIGQKISKLIELSDIIK